MIIRRIRALKNIRLATQVESAILVKDQIEDVRFGSQHELETLLSTGVISAADGKIVGLPIPVDPRGIHGLEITICDLKGAGAGGAIRPTPLPSRGWPCFPGCSDPPGR